MNTQIGSLRSTIDPGAFAVPGLTKQSRRRLLYALLIAADALAVALAFAFASLVHFDKAMGWQSTRLSGLIIPIFLALALNGRAYGITALLDYARGAMRATLAFLLAAGLILFVLDKIGVLHVFNGWLITYSIGASIPAILAGRALVDRVARSVLDNRPLHELVIVDGIPSHAERDTPVVGDVILDADAAGIAADVSDPMMLDRFGTLLKNVDRVTIACAPERQHDWRLILKGAAIDGEVHASDRAWPANTPPAIDPSDHPAHLPTAIDILAKRVFDLVFVLAALAFLAPLMLIVALAIKIDSSGPVFFVQQRVGRGNRLFRMYKFRSMRTDSCDADGRQSTSRDDDRITRVGRLLRATSIDELPQLFNVLTGSMSIVGPRPHALGSTASEKLFWDIDRRYWLRHTYPPGLTGLAQIRGHRGATLHERDLENRLASDLEYVQRWSLWLDMKIVLQTFGVIVHPNAF